MARASVYAVLPGGLSPAAGWAQSVFAERERARFVNENEITLPPEGIPAGDAGPVAIVTGTRTRQTRPGNEDQ